MPFRHKLLFTILLGWTLHVTVGFVVHPSASQPTTIPTTTATTTLLYQTRTPRQARIEAPLSLLSSLLLPIPPAIAAIPTLPSAPSTTTTTTKQLMQTYFPGALPSSTVVQRLHRTLRQYTSTNTLLASSLCSDELNDEPSSLMSQLERTFHHGSFSLGGLGGLPFAGISGIQAMISHVPSQSKQDPNGNILLVFGPHVGIASSSSSSSSNAAPPRLGKIHRHNQDHDSSACGAALGAYRRLLKQQQGRNNNKNNKNDKLKLDLQQEYIVEHLRPKLASILRSNPKTATTTTATTAAAAVTRDDENAAVALVTNSMYELIWDMLEQELQQVNTLPMEITLLGGIILQTESQEYFQPLKFQTWNNNGNDKVDLMSQTFGGGT